MDWFLRTDGRVDLRDFRIPGMRGHENVRVRPVKLRTAAMQFHRLGFTYWGIARQHWIELEVIDGDFFNAGRVRPHAS